jgi:CheY-like chemotaxis protein
MIHGNEAGGRSMPAETIRAIVDWLRQVEHLANEVYLLAATKFDADAQMKDFLEHLAEDEAWHFHVMGSAADELSTGAPPAAAIAVDVATGERILGYLHELKRRLGDGAMAKEQLIDLVSELERSEWNDIFLYVVNVMKERTREFRYPAARMQAHIKEVEAVAEQLGLRAGAAARLRDLPKVWVENILVVDDEPLMTQLLRRLLARVGNVDVAHGGREALEMMATKYYKVVLTDIDMPGMSGFALYEEATARYRSSGTRFLFMTGDASPERVRYLDAHGLGCVEKPMEVATLQREVMKRMVAK